MADLLDHQFAVQSDNHRCDEPGDYRDDDRAGELAHFGFAGGELHQWHHRKRQLQAQNHLRENQQLVCSLIAADRDNDDRRNYRDRARDQPP